ncbi:MAG: ferredoxin [Prochlorococcaceae cyanobacterium]
MARPSLRLDANAPGAFYVDSSCIDCGTCWQWDPGHFAPIGTTAHIHRQPGGEEETRQALLALQACPVAAIGAPPDLLGRTEVGSGLHVDCCSPTFIHHWRSRYRGALR